MHIIDVIYNKYYPLTIFNRWKARRNNKKQDITILCANCMGGYIYHQLGLAFNSPTINLMMKQPDLYKLVNNIAQYRTYDFQPIKGGGRLHDINIYFTHYSSYEEGKLAWHKRFARIIDNEIYIIASDRDGLTAEQIYNYKNVHCRKLVIFTAKKYDLPYCFQVKNYVGDQEIGNILGKTLSGKWRFEQFFDYVRWLNSDDPVAEHFRLD